VTAKPGEGFALNQILQIKMGGTNPVCSIYRVICIATLLSSSENTHVFFPKYFEILATKSKTRQKFQQDIISNGGNK
jgi:hypothetical protein